MKVLITGGAGYIGSTIASACIDQGFVPVILDDLSTGRREFTRDRCFFRGDIADGSVVDEIFQQHPEIMATIHCAARIVVPESVAQPLRYYRDNVSKTVDLVEHLLRNGCRRVIFSSSASIYAPSPLGYVDESSPISPTSPYARTKAILESVFEDLAHAYGLRVISLRYFNPVGADPRMRTGLQFSDPTHLLGRLIQAHANGRRFQITGVDWETVDGTGIRDYVHVWDLAEAHVASLRRFDQILPSNAERRYEAINLGTGRGTTVRQFVAAFQEVVGDRIQVEEAPRRPGDVLGCYASPRKAAVRLRWSSRFDITQAIRHSLEWNTIRPGRLSSDGLASEPSSRAIARHY